MVTRELRDRENRVHRATERYRRHRTIDPDHWHYRLYMAWLRAKDPRRKPQLNFCHYWRVVLVFALPRLLWSRVVWPQIMRLRNTFWVYQVGVLGGLLALLGLFIYSLIAFAAFRNVVAWFAGTVLSLWGITITTNYCWCVFTDSTYSAWVNLRKAPKWWGVPTLVVFGGPGAAIALVMMLVMACLNGIAWVVEESNWPQRTGQKLKTVAHALNAHPANRPLLRPWIVTGTLASAAWIFMTARAYKIPTVLLVCLLAAVLIMAAFTVTLGLMAIERRMIRKEENEALAIFNVIGFRKWLWTSDNYRAQSFRHSYGYRFRGREKTTGAELAAAVDLEDARNLVFEFLLVKPLPVSQHGTIPRRLVPRQRRQANPDTPTFRQRWTGFWSATWALIRLMWAGMVFVKRVGACPTLSVKEADTDPHASNERVVNN